MFAPETKFLIVDDMPSLRDVLKALLKKAGFSNVTEANDGQEAYQLLIAAKASGSQYDVIICDWNMPNMNGLELLKVVRAVNAWNSVPFILLTTESEKGKVMEAIAAGATNYMVKPVQENTLVEKLKAAYDKVKK